MKKLNRIISFILGITSAVALVSCDTLGNSSSSSSSTSTIPESIVYANFEQWAPDFQLIRVQDHAGVVHINKDKQFAKDNQSLLIHPVGSRNGSTGRFIFPLASELFEFDYRDFRIVRKITLDFYNAETETVKIALGLTPTIHSIDTHSYTPYEWHDLAPNTWTTVEYNVDLRALSFLYDVSMIDGIYLAFEHTGSIDEVDSPDIYCDNITIYNNAYFSPKTEGLKLGEMEYLDFEDPLQLMTLEKKGALKYQPNISIVKASDVTLGNTTLTATSGESVLAIEWQPSPNEAPGGYVTLQTTKDVIASSIFAKVTEEEAKNLVFCMDVYNACDREMYMEFDFMVGDDCIFGGWDLKPNTWTTVRYGMEDVLKKYPTFAKDGVLRFVMSYYSDYGVKTFYVDNMHFEWASEIG